MSAPRTGSPVVRGLIEIVPPFLVALLILPAIIRGGTPIPWAPQTTDLEVYVYAARDLLAGKDVYQTQSPLQLWFIYPPIAAILMVPLVVGPYVMWQVIWTGGLVAAQTVVLRRAGAPRGWRLAVLSIMVLVAMEPIRTTLGYGQVNTFLMLLVIADLLPDRPGERRRIPQGSLIGLAAAIKLTPLLFVVFLLLLGRVRAVITAGVVFVVLTVIGAVVMWQGTVTFFAGLLGGDTKTSGPQYVGNQAMSGVTTRLLGETTVGTVTGLAIGVIVALLATVVAVHWWRRGEKVFAVTLVGIGTLLASPLSWTHHWVWMLPLAVVAFTPSTLPRWSVWASRLLVAWVSVQLPLSVLPYQKGAANAYTAGQQVIANLGPVLAAVIVVGLAVTVVVTGPHRFDDAPADRDEVEAGAP